MQTVPIVIGVIALIFGVGYLVINTNDEATPVTSETTVTPEDTVVEVDTTEEIAVTENSNGDNQAESVESETTTDTTPGVYAAYDPNVIAQSEAEHILLFFHATWCPSCKALDADIVANIDKIPLGVEIYKTDYDTATDLKRKYGVTTQHSIIEISASGEAESSISHPLTLEGVLATI